MTSNPNLQTIHQELERAYAAQADGRDGLARVCARRAAGWAIAIHLQRKGIDLDTPSAFEAIQYLAAQSGNPPEIQSVLEHLVQKVAKDSLESDSYWPLSDVDLVEEAHWLCEHVLTTTFDIASEPK